MKQNRRRKRNKKRKKPVAWSLEKKTLLAITLQAIIMLLDLLLEVYREWGE